MATEEDFFAGKAVEWGLYEALKRELVWRYPGRWTHHIVLASAEEIDAELLAWIDRAHQFAQR